MGDLQWHRMDVKELLDHFCIASLATGHRQDDIPSLLKNYGMNKRPGPPIPSTFTYVQREFVTILCTLILTNVFLHFLAKKDSFESVVLHAVFLLGTMVHPVYVAIRTKQAESGFRAMESLIKYAAVIRDGETRHVDSKFLVPGDIVLLTPGSKVLADLRISGADGLLIDNSDISGESDSVKLNIEVSHLEAAYARNMAYSGAMILEGTGMGIVVATGTDAIISKTTMLLDQGSEISSPEIREYTGTVISSAILTVTFLIAAVYLCLRYNLRPLGMPVFLICFACFNLTKNIRSMISGFYFFLLNSMANKQAIVKNMETLSTLQKVDCVVADLTTSLIRDNVSVVRCWEAGEYTPMPTDDMTKLLALIAEEAGDKPMDLAIKKLVEKRYGSAESIIDKNPKIKTTSSATETPPYLSCVRQIDEKRILIVLGKTIDIAGLCSNVKYKDEVKELDEELTVLNELVGTSEYLGMANITMAYKEIEGENFAIGDLTIGALFELLEKPKYTTKPFYSALMDNNVKLYLTCNQPAAKSLALARMFHYADSMASYELQLSENVSLAEAQERADTLTLSGKELSTLTTMPEMNKLAEKQYFLVYEAQSIHRKQLVEYLQSRGNTVACIGYDAADAPSLKKADVGIALGASSSEVAKETADVIVLNDEISVVSSIMTTCKNVSNIAGQTFMGMMNIPSMVLVFLSVYYNFQISSLGFLLMQMDYTLPGVSIFWGTGVHTKNSVYLSSLSGIQSGVACTWAGLFTFFHCIVDGVDLEHAQTSFMMSAIIAEWLYYASVTFKFFLEDFDLSGSKWVHIVMACKTFIFILLCIYCAPLGFKVKKAEHFILPAINYFIAVWGVHLAKNKVFG